MYEFHLFEPLDEEINAKKVIAVEDATYAKGSLKRLRLIRHSNPELCDNAAAF